MNQFISSLLQGEFGITKNYFWNNIVYMIPLLVLVVLFVLGQNVIKEYLLSRKVKKFMSAGGLHTSDERLKRYYRDLG